MCPSRTSRLPPSPQSLHPADTELKSGEDYAAIPLTGRRPKMADFDAIYEDEDENSSILEAPSISLIPDPVLVRGAGNITV